MGTSDRVETMKLVALVRAPAPPLREEAAGALAEASGLAPAEARLRLAPEPPALLARLEAGEADSLVVRLSAAGLHVLAVDATPPGDQDRTVARSVAIDDESVTLVPRFGESMQVRWPDMLAVLRGSRASRSETVRTEKSKSFSLGTAIATGGLKLSRTSTRTARSSEESTEQVILVYARDGRAAILAEREVEFSCLGATMQPSSTANMMELARRVREKATGAFYDERLLRLGRRPLPFLGGGESLSRTATATTTRSDTTSSLDVLAEIMRRALREGLLP